MDKAQMKEFIARRAAQELENGSVVNLGIGIPTLCTRYLPDGVRVILQSENGIVDTEAATEENRDPLHVTDAGGAPTWVRPGGCFIDSAMSFALIRGGHVHAAVLGGLEVDEEGNLANWCVPGKKMPGMGGAMDLLAGVKRVIVAMEHTAGSTPKIRKRCTLPLTGLHCVNRIITEMAVFDVTPQGLVLLERNPEYTMQELRAATEADFTVSGELKDMT